MKGRHGDRSARLYRQFDRLLSVLANVAPSGTGRAFLSVRSALSTVVDHAVAQAVQASGEQA